MVKYSVLMSVYFKENADYLKKSIESMINQTVVPDEILIVEDGPLTKELYAVIDEFIKNYPYLFTIITNKNNIGLGLSLRRGLEACRNEFIARMDTDDISLNNRCKLQIEYLCNNPNCDIVGGQISEFIDKEDNIVSHRLVPTDDNSLKKFLKKRCPFNHMSVMYRKSSILRAGNYEHVLYNEDYYLWAKMAFLGMCFSNLDIILVNVRISKSMFKRRGGFKYFKNELFVQKYMVKNKMINRFTYFNNVFKRFLGECIAPSWFRAILYKMLLRKR